MPITLGANIASLRAQAQLNRASERASTSFERLSSGLRINHASDDPAGLAIVAQLNSSHRVYTRGIKNFNDGLNVLTMMDGVLEQTSGILARAKELAAQAANGVYSTTQRGALNTELQSILQEYNRIIQSSEFNGVPVLGAESGAYVFQGGYGTNGAIRLDFGAAVSTSFDYGEGTALVGTALGGAQTSGGGTLTPRPSPDGRYVTYASNATNIVAGDSNGVQDVFMLDRETGLSTLISVSTAGVQGDLTSGSGTSASANGRYVVFESNATNLVAGDSNANYDVFIRDTLLNTTTRVSVDSSGIQSNGSSSRASITDDGRYVFFESTATNLVASDTNATTDIFMRDLQTGSTTRVSVSTSSAEGNGQSTDARISADGRYVVFGSAATNFVGVDSNGALNDIFVRDIQSGTTTLISQSTAGVQQNNGASAPSLSADGLFATFLSTSNNLVGGDTNGVQDAFLRNLTTGETTRISIATDGTQGNNGVTTRATLSSDGRYALFGSNASNMVSGDTNATTDVFLRDISTGTTIRVSQATAGTEANSFSQAPELSRDGQYAYYQSNATNLTGGDSNGLVDVFGSSNPLYQGTGDYLLSTVSALDISTQADAQSTLTLLDTYVNEVLTLRGKVGSGMARLQIASNNLESQTAAYKSAQSAIEDVDVAAEAAALIASNVKIQVTTALLAQARQTPQIVLQLLKG